MISFPKCDFCIHRHEDNGNEWEDVIYCDAFPDGKPWKEIPEEYWKECANGIKYADEDGEREYKEYVPNPNSILEKMFIVGGQKCPLERESKYKKK